MYLNIYLGRDRYCESKGYCPRKKKNVLGQDPNAGLSKIASWVNLGV